MKKLFCMAMAVCCLFCLSSCSKDDDTKSLSFSPSSVTLSVGDSQTVSIVAQGLGDPYSIDVDYHEVVSIANCSLTNDKLTVTGTTAGSGNYYIYFTDDHSISAALKITVK